MLKDRQNTWKAILQQLRMRPHPDSVSPFPKYYHYSLKDADSPLPSEKALAKKLAAAGLPQSREHSPKNQTSSSSYKKSLKSQRSPPLQGIPEMLPSSSGPPFPPDATEAAADLAAFNAKVEEMDQAAAAQSSNVDSNVRFTQLGRGPEVESLGKALPFRDPLINSGVAQVGRVSKLSVVQPAPTPEGAPPKPHKPPPFNIGGQSHTTENGVSVPLAVKLWVFAWNMGAKDLFASDPDPYGGPPQVKNSELKKIVNVIPLDMDVYVFGVQECSNDLFFDLVAKHLGSARCMRVHMKQDSDRVWGRGDGSFVNPKVRLHCCRDLRGKQESFVVVSFLFLTNKRLYWFFNFCDFDANFTFDKEAFTKKKIIFECV